jgi:hypothetical protein
MTRAQSFARRRLLLGAAGAIAWFGSRPVRAGPASYSLASFPPPGRLEYRILREGEEIGRNSIEFTRSAGRLTVVTQMEALFTLVSIPVFRFKHVAEEGWVDSRLETLSSRTDDNGTDRAVELRTEGDRLRVVYNGKEVNEYDAPMIPASLWHPATVEQKVLFDPIKGRPRQVSIARRGRERVEIGGDPVPADHFSITGQLKREVWYGLDGQIVQVSFPAKDGSTIVIVRRA